VKRLINAVSICAVALTAAAVVPALASGAPSSTTCTSTLAPGTYGSVDVPSNAVCIIESGPLTITNGLTIGSGATFVFGDEGSPDVTATISGGVHATDAANVQIHFSTINGGIDVQGGFGVFGRPFGLMWNTIEDSTINGGATMAGYNGFWMGFIRNTVHGPVNLNNNVLADIDGNEYVTNTIYGGLHCAGNWPEPQIGDSEGSPNQVSGPVTGQCTNVV
jgi:hypothetical protein